MFKYSTSEILTKMTLRRIEEQYPIEEDPVLHRFIENHIEEEDILFGDILSEVNELLEFEYEERYVPQSILEESADYNYFFNGVFYVPGLMPYVNHPLFSEFVDQIEIIQRGSYASGIELVYLPNSRFVTCKDSTSLIFGNQPATFIVGMQTDGGLSTYDVVEFLIDFRTAMQHIKELVEN